MNDRDFERWVHRLAQYDPADADIDLSPRDIAYSEMVKAGVSLEDRVAINMDASNLWRRRGRVDGRYRPDDGEPGQEASVPGCGRARPHHPAAGRHCALHPPVP